MSIKSIYDALRAAGMTAEGACGLMGNMKAESGMKANIAQRGMTSLSDAEYTNRADTGMLDFVYDSVGYGLCQWTYWSRKQALLNYARAMGVSVGDEAMQVQFCIQELRHDYGNIFKLLCTSHDLYECTRRVCLDYERPASPNVDARYSFALDFFGQLAGGSDPDPAPAPQPDPSPETKPTADVTLLQTAMALDGAWDMDKIDGINTAEWRAAFRKYAELIF